MNPEIEQAALAALARRHPQEALAILMEGYDVKLAAFARRLARDHVLTKDVIQQVFWNAFRKFDTFEGRSSLWSWLCGITYHRCLDALRALPPEEGIAADDAWDELFGSSDPAGDAERADKQRALEHCLSKLATPMRAQVLMRCFFGMSYEEIGREVGDAPGTVQVRISRILPRLRRCLQNQGVSL